MELQDQRHGTGHALACPAQGSVGEVERFLAAQGLNVRALVDGAQQASATAGDALETARPTVNSTVSTLATTDPVILAEYAGILAALYYLARPLVSSFGTCWLCA